MSTVPSRCFAFCLQTGNPCIVSGSASWSFFLIPLSPAERKCCCQVDSLHTSYCGTGNNHTDVCLIGTWNSREDFWNSTLAYKYQVRIFFCFINNVLNASASFLSWGSLYRNPGKWVLHILRLYVIKLLHDRHHCYQSPAGHHTVLNMWQIKQGNAEILLYGVLT